MKTSRITLSQVQQYGFSSTAAAVQVQTDAGVTNGVRTCAGEPRRAVPWSVQRERERCSCCYRCCGSLLVEGAAVQVRENACMRRGVSKGEG